MHGNVAVQAGEQAEHDRSVQLAAVPDPTQAGRIEPLVAGSPLTRPMNGSRPTVPPAPHCTPFAVGLQRSYRH
jgi:hypothetical protein